jgi:hypothetical protein
MTQDNIQFTPQQIEELTKAIVQNHHPSATHAMVDPKKAFCDNWANAKNVLQMLQPILVSVPGVGIFAGPAIAVVIAAGDAAKNAVCK